MTANQIAYQTMLEQKRANLAKERENERSNRRKEFLTKEAQDRQHQLSLEAQKMQKTGMVVNQINEIGRALRGAYSDINQMSPQTTYQYRYSMFV